MTSIIIILAPELDDVEKAYQFWRQTTGMGGRDRFYRFMTRPSAARTVFMYQLFNNATGQQ